MRPYLRLLQLPGALRFCLAALVGRTPIAMLGLGSVLLVQDRRGSYALAGAVAGALALGSAVGQPLVSRLVDGRGQAAVLAPTVAVQATALVGLVLSAAPAVPAAVVLACAAVAGAAGPPLGACVRARWSVLLRRHGDGDHAPLLDTAFALESVLDEVVFVAGPALVVALAVAVDPAVALLVAVALVTVGTAALALQRSTEPPPRPPARTPSALRTAGVRTLTLTMIAVGTLFGGIEVAMVAFAAEQHHRAAAAVLLPLVAVGSGVSGLVYGTRRFRRALDARLLLALAALVLGTLLLVAAPGLVAMGAAGLVAGVAVSPTLIASTGLMERVVREDARTEGFTWLVAGLNVGGAIGASVAGVLDDGPGSRAAFGLCAAAAVVALGVAAAGRPTLVSARLPGVRGVAAGTS